MAGAGEADQQKSAFYCCIYLAKIRIRRSISWGTQVVGVKKFGLWL